MKNIHSTLYTVEYTYRSIYNISVNTVSSVKCNMFLKITNLWKSQLKPQGLGEMEEGAYNTQKLYQWHIKKKIEL